MSQMQNQKKIKVILTKRVINLGKTGEVVYVKKGYFRNYLSNKCAMLYSDENLAKIKSQINTVDNEKAQQEAQNIFDQLNNKYLMFERQASGTLILFGSVSKKDICVKIKEEFNLNISSNKILINKAIKTVGIHSISIDLFDEINCEMFISIGRSLSEAKELIEKQGGISEQK